MSLHKWSTLFRTLLVFAGLAGILAGCGGQGQTGRTNTQGTVPDNSAGAQVSGGEVAAGGGENREEAAAIINGEKVTLQELESFARTMVPGFQGQLPQEWSLAIDELINNRLLARRAIRENVSENSAVKVRVEIAVNTLWEEPYWNAVVRSKVKLTDKDFNKNAPRFEDLVTVRQMVHSNRDTAESLREQALANPAGIEELIKERSEGLTARSGGLIRDVTPVSPQYSKQILSSIFRSKVGDITPVFESPIGYTFFQVVGRMTADEAREKWKRTAAPNLMKEKSSRVWEEHVNALVKKRRLKIREASIAAFSEARRANKDMSAFANKPMFSIDDTTFTFGMIADPSGTGVLHGDQAIETIMEKRIRQYVIDREMNRLKIKEGHPDVLQKERFIRENILARAYIEQRTRGIKVDEGSSRTFYDRNKERFVSPRMVDISAIETKSSGRLKDIYRALSSGRDFGEVANEWSDNRQKHPGGRIGPIPEDKLSPEFQIVKSLKEGRYTEKPVVLTAPDDDEKLYVVLKLNRIEEEKPIPFEKVNRENLKLSVLALEREKVVKTVLDELRRDNRVEIPKSYYDFVSKKITKNNPKGGRNG